MVVRMKSASNMMAKWYQYARRFFIPGREEPIRLGKDSPALHVLQRVRDEAHRFAVTYHRLRRKKTLLGPEDRSVS